MICTRPHCPLAMCSDCLSFDGVDKKEFICPSCWDCMLEEANKTYKVVGPYPVRSPNSLSYCATFTDWMAACHVVDNSQKSLRS